MTTDVVTYESRDGVAIITLNRPAQLNAFTSDQFARSDTARATVSTMATMIGKGLCRRRRMVVGRLGTWAVAAGAAGDRWERRVGSRRGEGGREL